MLRVSCRTLLLLPGSAWSVRSPLRGDESGDRRAGIGVENQADTPLCRLANGDPDVKEKIGIFYVCCGTVSLRSSGGFEDLNKGKAKALKKRKAGSSTIEGHSNSERKGGFEVFKRKLFRQGSSVGVVIPSKICEAKGWRVGKEVVIGLAKDKSVRVESVAVREK